MKYDIRYLEKSLVWLNDREIQRLIDSSVVVTPESQAKWYSMIVNNPTYRIWGIEYNGEPIGACGIKHIDNEMASGEYWGYIGEKEYWGGKGHLIFEQIYQEAIKLGLKKLTLSVLTSNQRAIALYLCENFRIVKEIEEKLYMMKTL